MDFGVVRLKKCHLPKLLHKIWGKVGVCLGSISILPYHVLSG